MIHLCMHFQVHQPWRLRSYRYTEVGKTHDYFDDDKNAHIMRQVAERCYLPMNNLLLDLLTDLGGAFKVSFSLTGTFLEQAERFAPEVIHSFRRLVETGQVELLSQTSHHSFSALLSPEELAEQLRIHGEACGRLGQVSKVFHDPRHAVHEDLSPSVARLIRTLGYNGLLLDDSDRLLGPHSHFFACGITDLPGLTVLPRSSRLSDDIGFRYSDRSWPDFPLTADKFAGWVDILASRKSPRNPTLTPFVGLFVNYESFGEHHRSATGIFEFMRQLPKKLLEGGKVRFLMPSEAVSLEPPVEQIRLPELRLSRRGFGSPIQNAAIDAVYRIEQAVKATQDPAIIETWRRLTTGDHFHYMNTRYLADRNQPWNFNPYESPYDAHIYFMNAIADLEQLVGVGPVEEERLPA